MPSPKNNNAASGMNLHKKTLFFLICFVAIIFFIIGISFSDIFLNKRPDNTAGYPIRLGASGLINPLLLGADSAGPSGPLDPLRYKINSKINDEIKAGLASDVGVYFRYLNSGQWTGVNYDHGFSPASLLKVPVMITYLRIADTKPDTLNNRLLYDGSFNDNQAENIKPLKQIEAGKSYTVDQLLGFMIEYSDNNAKDLLDNHIDAAEISKTYADLQIQQPTSTGDVMTPQFYARFFRVLYAATYLGKKSSEKALELLSYPDLPQGLEAGIPANINFANKFGERNFVNVSVAPNKELQDCGIVYHPEKPYIICVMTKGYDFINLENLLRDIGATVWKEVNNSR